MLPLRADSMGLASLAAGAAGLLLWAAADYAPLTLALVLASVVQAGACLWSCRALYGKRSAWIFLATGATLGWLAEQAGSTLGWFFGDYTYTAVLGPRLGAVPLVIPMMWFGLCHIGLVLASLLLWRQPLPAARGWAPLLLTAWLAAMVVTAFDLGADPYFVYQLKAWIMGKTDGGWFGETVKGFEGWMIVSFAIVVAFQALARPALQAGPDTAMARKAALLPIALYAFMMLFQLAMSQTLALRVVAFFAMGIPVLAAWAAWWHWSRPPAAAGVVA